MKRLTFAPDDPASTVAEKHLDTIFDQRALDMPPFEACLKENRSSATINLSEEFEIELGMVTEIVLTFCEPIRLPHNLEKIIYCIEQWHRHTQLKRRQDAP